MGDFRHPALQQLTDQQVRYAPPVKRREQLAQAGKLLGTVDVEKQYPYQFVCFRVTGFLPTGRGTHGLYPSRDARFLYATNRGEGSVSVIDFATQKVVHKWTIPGGGSPDMGGVSADGNVLWLSGRYHSEVYAIDTATGKLLARTKVGKEPHGLCVWPQPGRYSLGHTGLMR